MKNLQRETNNGSDIINGESKDQIMPIYSQSEIMLLLLKCRLQENLQLLAGIPVISCIFLLSASLYVTTAAVTEELDKEISRVFVAHL